MTQEEAKRRSEDAKVQYIKDHLCDKDGDKPFVFISYKSDDWEIVLQDVVYRLVKDYGLNVYFDGSFDDHVANWIKQFPKNMESSKCKGVLAFLDNKYAQSYATLMELMYSQTKKASFGGKKKGIGLPVVPVNLEKMMDCDDDSDTGLGVEIFPDGTKNLNAVSERMVFDNAYNQMVKRGILDGDWYETGEPLSKSTCDAIISDLITYLKVNENPYQKMGSSLKGIIASIRDACGDEVFQTVEETVDDVKQTPASVQTEQGPGTLTSAPKTAEAEPSAPKAAETAPPAPKPVSEECPDTISVSASVQLYHMKAPGKYDAYYLYNEDETFTLLKGSRIADTWREWAGQKLVEEIDRKIGSDHTLTADVQIGKPSALDKVIKGYSTSGKDVRSEKFLVPKNRMQELPEPVRSRMTGATSADGPGTGDLGAETSEPGGEAPGPETSALETSGLRGVDGEVLSDDEISVMSASSKTFGRQKAKKMSLAVMVEQKIVQPGDEVFVKDHPGSAAFLEPDGSISYEGQSYSLNQYVKAVKGEGNYNAYIHVKHKASGKFLDELREKAE